MHAPPGPMSLSAFLDRYRAPITRAVNRTYPPRYTAALAPTLGYDLARLGRRPLGAQAHAIRAAALALREGPSATIVGEMGCGKSFVGAAAAFFSGARRVLILCPPHLTRKWVREIRATVPGARVAIARTITDLERLREADARPTLLVGLPGQVPATPAPRFVVLSREAAKLSHLWRPAAVERPIHRSGGAGQRELCCPDCFAPIADDEGIPLARAELATKKRRCRQCDGHLWTADAAPPPTHAQGRPVFPSRAARAKDLPARVGPRKYPLADYIRRRLPGFFDLLVADEVHEFKGRGSAQGLAAGALADACGKKLTLTGTLMGGYASTLFHLLWRFNPAIRAEFGRGDEAKWVARYGIVERITTKPGHDEHQEDGRRSKRRAYAVRTVERPGISPAVLFHLIPTTVFLRLADIAADLPAYTERVATVPLGDTPTVGLDGTPGPSQRETYTALAEELTRAVREALARKSKRLLGAYIQALLAYPDACIRAETVVDKRHGIVVASAPALPEGAVYPKEQLLLDLVRRDRFRGRRTLVFCTHTETRDITPRLRAVLEREGFRVAVLKATVKAEVREEWIADRVAEGVEVLLCNPRLVATGLDLLDFPSLCWYQTDYSVYTMRQASRRSWRPGQTSDVEVTFLAYRGTLQERALGLVAAKVKAALIVEGELPDDGLAGLDADEHDQVVALAKRLVDPDAADDASLEAMFAESRALEAAAKETLAASHRLDPDPTLALTALEARDCLDHAAHRGATAAAAITPPSRRVAQLALDLAASAPSDAPTDIPAAREPTVPPPIGRVMRFEDLAALARPRGRRRKGAPVGQLDLFTS